ncbi:intercellular adhesion molecule 5-like, partial [Passer montanus]|uniref:intercellular adhesion molecule 5-like n=1 Tax=Passer montanus TaxID=9160 RepID=UPI00196099E1
RGGVTRRDPQEIRGTFRAGGVGDTRGHPGTSAVGRGLCPAPPEPPGRSWGTARGGGLAGVARGSFTVAAWPRVAVVAFGGSVTVNCSRSACPGDNATLGLETPLPATPAAGGLRWQSFRLHNVSRWDPGPLTCSGRCGDTEANASAGVLVYQLPERVELEPVAPVAVGDSRTLTCRVLGVAPLRNLTVTLRRGAETLRTESFGDAEGSASVAVSHLLTATRGDHGQHVTCHAELSLRPHGPLFARAAAPVTLSVFALPEPPQLQAPAILEAGTAATARCRIAGAFPAGDTRVTAALGPEPLNVTVAVAGDTVTASAELSPRSPGPRELSCTAAVASAARTARRQLHVYRFPAPALELSPAPAAAGSEVTVTCHAGATEPPAARLQLRDADGGVLAEGPQPRLQLRLLARRDDDGREFRCRASLAVGDSVVTKDAEARLAVLYLPEIPASGCPGNRTWVRGSREALSCLATGNPAPTVVCGRDGVAVATGEPEPVTRARAGTYLCNATNALGTRSRRVTVRVEYEPTLSEAGCPARRVWLEGQRRQLECRADGDPPPSTRCARDGGTRDGDTSHGGTSHGGTSHGDTRLCVPPQDEPTLSEAGCPARRVWLEGQRRQLECRADGDPPPSTRCARDGGTSHGDTSHGDTNHGGTNHGGTRDGDTNHGDTNHGDTNHGGTRDGGTRNDGTNPGGTRDGDTDHGGIDHGGTNHGDTSHGGTQHGGVARGRVVTRADGGRYVCRATNRHGVAVRSVLVTVECECDTGDGRGHRAGDRGWDEDGDEAEPGCARTAPAGAGAAPGGSRAGRGGPTGVPRPHHRLPRRLPPPPDQPSLGERGCPERRRWLEGTPAELGCAASGNPPPRVTCAKLGDPANATDSRDPPRATRNVTRAHAGTYQCRASNAHGAAVRNVTVAVEYGPAAVTLRVLPSANVTRGGGFTVDCGAEGVPAPTYSWALPPAPNARLAADNRSVTVTGATAANRGLYTCTASNRHGRSAASVAVRVDESWLAALAALGALGAVAALALAAAGGFYLKSTACKKGEYNVRDAEGSCEGGAGVSARWPRDPPEPPQTASPVLVRTPKPPQAAQLAID